MVKTGYQLQFDGSEYAKAMAKNKPISVKYATEICREIKGKPVSKALSFLNDVLAFKRFVPFRKYDGGTAHRKGDHEVKAGRYPAKACKVFIEVIESAKNNAIAKGLDEEKLLVRHAFAGQGFARTFLQSKGKIGGKSRQHKSAHVEVVLQETKGFASTKPKAEKHEKQEKKGSTTKEHAGKKAHSEGESQ